MMCRSLRRIGLCRASRTDKGVHAACNALTVRLHLDAARDFCPLEEKENALCASPRALATWNSHLAPDVRIMGAVRNRLLSDIWLRAGSCCAGSDLRHLHDARPGGCVQALSRAQGLLSPFLRVRSSSTGPLGSHGAIF
jgi:hypothetical protein